MCRLRRRKRGAVAIEVDSDDDQNQNAKQGDEEPQDSDDDYSQASSPSPRKRRGKRRRYEDDDYSDEEDHKKSWDNMGRKEKDKLVGDVMRYVLFQHVKKLPVKKEVLNKVIYKGKRMYTTQIKENVIQRAKSRFKQIFGYEFTEIKNREEHLLSQPKKNVKTVYILKNGNSPKENLQTNQWENETVQCNRGLLMMILSNIFLSSGQIGEDLLLRRLEEWGISQQFERRFGETKKLLQRLVQSQYLKKVRDERASEESQSGGVKWAYVYGGRTLMETSEEMIYTFITKMMGQKRSSIILKDLRKRNPDARQIEDIVPPPPAPPQGQGQANDEDEVEVVNNNRRSSRRRRR